MEDNQEVTVGSSDPESGEGSTATKVDKSAEVEKKSDSMVQGNPPPISAKVPDEVSAHHSGKAQGTSAGTPIPNGALAGTAQGVSADLIDAIKQAVVDALREEKTLAVLPEIKELLSQMITSAQTAATPAAYPSLEKIDEIKGSFRQTILDGYREQYGVLSENWKGLETKAQGTVTIAGIFIAAAFTFAKDLANTRLDFYGNLLLGAAIVFLIPSVLFSVMALKTREIHIPPSGDTLKQMADLLLSGVIDAQLPGIKRSFIYDQAEKWKDVIKKQEQAIKEKERWLHIAQVFLLIAVSIAAALTLKLLKF